MLSAEEDKFLKYWERNREIHSTFSSKLMRGLPMGIVFGLPILLFIVSVYLFLPEWYTKVSKNYGSSFFMIVVAVIIAIIFYAFVRMHFKWEMNEQAYLELKQKQKKAEAAKK